MSKNYTNEFLISELHRFVHENERNPTIRSIRIESSYPSSGAYEYHFGSWNKALIAAGLKINETCEKRTGKETCYLCGGYDTRQQGWHNNNLQKGQLLCNKCYQASVQNYDHKNGNLDVNSKVGFGFLTQRIVAKTLSLGLKHDCNCSINFHHPFDLYDKNKYGKIDVKGSKLHKSYNWEFSLSNNKTINTHILVGFNENKKDLLRVWIIDSHDKLTLKNGGIYITNNIHYGLKKFKHCEVDPTPYINTFHAMSIENCSVLTYKE